MQACEDVRKRLTKLVELSRLEDAKSLALKLMRGGSHQVEYRAPTKLQPVRPQ